MEAAESNNAVVVKNEPIVTASEEDEETGLCELEPECIMKEESQALQVIKSVLT